MMTNASTASGSAQAWQQLTTFLRTASVLNPNAPTLSEYALGANFDPKAVIERLLSPEPSYFAHKDILFAGLCAWTVAPNHPHIVREAMVLAGVSRLAELERRSRAKLPQDAFLADIVNRIIGPGIDFYEDFYYPAGGLQRVVNARSPGLLKRSLLTASKEVGFSVEMMRVSHDHAARLRGHKSYRAASIDGCSEAASKLFIASRDGECLVNQLLRERARGRTVDPTNFRKKGAKFFRPTALIYAASSVTVGRTSFLEYMRSGDVSYRKHGGLLLQWLGRAAYTATKIIKPMYTRESSAEQVDFLASVREIEIAPPELGAGCAIVDGVFKTN